ncbi:methionine ABC transporter permease [Thermomonospora cellulosilytica]|uniref:D-methionine transport system permease protein n=1 Tax=Thermomonospora cellulosilytica TaxID=1411118 RepID=A0A7W3MYU1_9ACTN|nr:methionine ABC transporter permease [Thermomonospora cellulosilytica]MBA9004405.1 D-methionine transport system permease protein [Thermomonospora cellulosilytica]
MTWDEIAPLLRDATLETLQMTWWSSLLTALGGLLLGVLLVLTDRRGLLPAPPVHQVLGAVVNVGRSLPFIILMVAILPFTRAVTGTTIGTTAAIVPLAVAAIPFYARLVETALREVDPAVIAAARAMGASRRQIVGKVLLREARPGLVAGLTVTVIALIGYSAMAGAIGGGGLGDLAVRYGYQRFETGVMVATVVVLIVVVQLVQMLGDLLTRRLTHR